MNKSNENKQSIKRFKTLKDAPPEKDPVVRIRTVDDKKNAVVSSDMDNISIVESDDLFASDENEARKIRFHGQIEPQKDKSPDSKQPSVQKKADTRINKANAVVYKRSESLQDRSTLAKNLAKPVLVQSNNKSSASRQSHYGREKKQLKTVKKPQPKPQNVKNTVIFNNVFYDITQFDIKSNGSAKPLLTSGNKSLSKNRSQEKYEYNISLERSLQRSLISGN